MNSGASAGADEEFLAAGVDVAMRDDFAESILTVEKSVKENSESRVVALTGEAVVVSVCVMRCVMVEVTAAWEVRGVVHDDCVAMVWLSIGGRAVCGGGLECSMLLLATKVAVWFDTAFEDIVGFAMTVVVRFAIVAVGYGTAE